MNDGKPGGECLLSVDVEDYFQVEAFASVIERDDWPHLESRVERNTERVLALLAECRSTATFFILGWVADRFPRLVQTIQAQGHEIACHSYWHRQIFRLDSSQFREDTRRAKAVIEQAAGAPVVGYRAPSFSVVRKSLWALEVLVEEGFRYDASIYPIHHDNYGIPDWNPNPQWLTYAAGRILEIPNSTVRVLGTNLPCGGGGYLRLLPFGVTRAALRRITRTAGRHAVIYVHPWEFDPEQPRIRASRLSRFRHYTNLHQTESRLRRLLHEFPMKPMRELLDRSAAG